VQHVEGSRQVERLDLGLGTRFSRFCDISVDHDVGYVHPLWSQFASHYLRQRAQPELSDCEIDEALAALGS